MKHSGSLLWSLIRDLLAQTKNETGDVQRLIAHCLGFNPEKADYPDAAPRMAGARGAGLANTARAAEPPRGGLNLCDFRGHRGVTAELSVGRVLLKHLPPRSPNAANPKAKAGI